MRPSRPRPPRPKPPHPPDRSASGARPDRRLFTQGYVLGRGWTIAVVALAAVGCLAIRSKAAGQDHVAVAGAEPGQMAGTMSSPGSSGQSPGSASGTVS